MSDKNGNEAAVPKLGARLRQGREALGLSVDEAGKRLRLPHQVVRRIENDDLGALGAPVFVRGYLKSYARLVGIDEREAEDWLPEAAADPPPLIPTGTVPLSRRLLSRYARHSLYIVLTAITVVPVLVLALGGHLSQDSRLADLDGLATDGSQVVAEVETIDSEAAARQALVHQGPPAPLPSGDLEKRPVLASMLPAPRQAARDDGAEPSGASVRIRLDQGSWIEVNDAQGRRLEYDLLPAGSERSYPLGSGLTMSIGNAEGATVSVDDSTLDLSGLSRANVARFRVSSEGDVQPASGG